MRIGFDARLYDQTGVGRYIKNLLSEFETSRQNNQYFIFLNSDSFKDFNLPDKNWHKISLDIKWHSIKEQFVMPIILKKYNLDLVHFPYFNVPIFYRGKYVLTVHDLIIDHFPTGRASTLNPLLYYAKWFLYRFIMNNSLRNAAKILTISNTTKNEIIRHYKIKPDKIVVTFDALDKNLLDLKKKYKPKKRLPFEYLLYVGNAYPHKNLENLCMAFSDVRINSRVKLVLAGDDWFFYPRLKIFAEKKQIAKHIIFFGKAGDKDLIDLYFYARGLVIPSLMEGFGLPPLEAVYYDTMPIVSDIPVFREIWGNDLIYFNPGNAVNIQKTLKLFLEFKKDKIKKDIRKAKKRLKSFSWKNSAEITLLQYKNISGKIDYRQ